MDAVIKSSWKMGLKMFCILVIFALVVPCYLSEETAKAAVHQDVPAAPEKVPEVGVPEDGAHGNGVPNSELPEAEVPVDEVPREKVPESEAPDIAPEGTCSREQDGCSDDNLDDEPLLDSKEISLFQHKFEKEGEIQTIHVDGRDIQIKAVSLKPNMFEIEDFLSNTECQHIIDLAQESGLERSITAANNAARPKRPVLRDMNGDKKLSLSEMMLTIEDSFDVYLEEDDIREMYKNLGIDPNNDDVITQDEMSKAKPADMEKYLQNLLKDQPQKHSRYSDQAFLFPDQSTDPVFIQIQRRVQHVTRLPAKLIEKSDFQVVKYTTTGHYNAHFDSSQVFKKLKCCTRNNNLKKPCRICRYMTVLFYLNDVDEGGGTAFIVAGNETVNDQKIRTEHKVNLQKYCNDAPLVVQPKKGKAIFWYNHLVDEKTGWLGELDKYSWHGGCPVEKGEKWISNFWIKVTDDKEESLS